MNMLHITCADICNTLLETFNINDIEKITNDKTIIAALYDIARMYENTINDNTLFQLIRNHFSRKIYRPITEFLGGPFHLTKHVNRNTNTTIYCFGERHSDIIDCPTRSRYQNIEHYMSNLLETTDAFIDFYIEVPAFDKDYYENIQIMGPQRMQSLFEEFYLCIQKSTRKHTKKCELSRVHYIDIRSSDLTSDGRTLLSRFTRIGQYNLENIKDPMVVRDVINHLNQNIKDIHYILNNIEIDTKERFYNYWYVKMTEDYKLRKELERSYLGDRIYDYLRLMTERKVDEYGYEFIRNLIANTRDMVNYYYDERNIFFDRSVEIQFLDDIVSLGRVIGNIIAVYIDGYCLARIFKNFKVSNHLNEPERPKNIIIYTEDRHVQNYRKFIEKNGFVLTEESGKFYERVSEPRVLRYCTDMRNIVQPLFSN